MTRAMLMMLFAMLILPGMDAVAKSLSNSVSAGQVSFARFFFQSIIMLPLLYWTRGKWLTSNLKFHVLRGALIACATLFFFRSLAFLPIADAISIFFIEPMLVTLLSVVILGESVGWRRLIAIAVGFAGALIVIRPSFTNVGLPVLFPVAAALCFSFYILLTRSLSAVENPVRMQFLAGLSGMVVTSIALTVGTASNIDALTVSWISLNQLFWLGLLGILGTVGHLFVVYAYRRAPVSILAPFQYVEIISATILGWMFFHDFPDTSTWVGILLIVGSGLFIFYREHHSGIRR